MELALNAATVAVSRAAAHRWPNSPPAPSSVLIPLPTAADNHQFYNASAFATPAPP